MFEADGLREPALLPLKLCTNVRRESKTSGTPECQDDEKLIHRGETRTVSFTRKDLIGDIFPSVYFISSAYSKILFYRRLRLAR